jgi:glycosyltransferase involved in cell wall biosynthesis
MKTTVVLLTWKRISFLKKTLTSLSKQTHKDFDVYISNGSLAHSRTIDEVAAAFSNILKITISHDGNKHYAFRRILVGEMLANSGTDVVLFLDDDVTISDNYVKDILSQYEPKSYASGFCWNFQENGKDYYRYRKKVFSNDEKIHYCGTGVSMVDASIFLEKRLINAPEDAYRVEDLWLSYFAQQILGWKLKYVKLNNVSIGGSDQNALYKQILRDKRVLGTPDKADFLRMLVGQYGWKL